MNKKTWKERWSKLSEKLQFLKLGEDPDFDDELDIEEKQLSSGEDQISAPSDGGLREILANNRRWIFRKRILVCILIIAIAGGFYLYNSLHTFRDYIITKSYENDVATGTHYEAVGKNIYRYNSDGISCVSRKNELKWSITYNMQGPIADVCGDVMAVAEQQGNQVYVVNKDGLVGNFETLLPILKVRVSKQGVVAVVLEEQNITWVNLYRPDGTAIASDKTTIGESGYPLDIALSPNGENLAVSYLGVPKGIVTSEIVFYNFGNDGKSSEDYVISKQKYQDMVVPELYFADKSTVVAVSEQGFFVFRTGKAPEETTNVKFDEEIISTFHDDSMIGFLFHSEKEGYRYRMEIYNNRGKKKAERYINAEFDKIKVQNGQIIMFDDRKCFVYTDSGRLRFESPYEKEIVDIFYFSEYRKYLVITQNSFDKIRIS